MSETTQAAVAQQGPASVASAPAQGSVSPTPDQARASLEQLRADRLEGKVTDRDFFERSDYLARLAHGEQNVAPPPTRFEHMTPQEQEQHLVDEAMQPAQADEYDLPGATSSRDLEVKSRFREAMADIGLPKQYGAFFYEQVDNHLQRFAMASPEAIDAHIASSTSKLQAQWGDQYEARIVAVSDLLDDVAQGNPFVARLLDHAPYVFADPWIMHTLWLVDERKKRRRS